jgi:hypothetical protein
MWLGSVALAVASTLRGPLTDLDEQIATESKADAEAAEEVKCWCKDLKETLDTRLRESAAEIQELETIRDTRYYENVGLKIQVKQHKDDVNLHSQSLGEADAINSKAHQSHSDEKEETQKALESLRLAIDKVPKGGEVHGTLQGLEEKFANKLQEAQEQHDRRQAQFEEVHAAKTEMMRLAKEGADMKMRRLADGELVIAQAKSEIAAFSAQQEADYALSASLKTVCNELSDSAAARLKQRQDAAIAISELKAKNAENVALAAASKISKVMLLRRAATAAIEHDTASSSGALAMLGASFKGDCVGARERAEDTKRRADEALAHAQKAGSDLMALVAKSDTIQAQSSKVLNEIVMNSHLATTKNTLADGIKTKVSALGETANTDLKAIPSLFNEIRAQGRKNAEADHKVVVSLQSAAASASKALVDANECH